MRPRDLVDLLLLAALWGGSFLLMRIAVPEFGPLPLMALRVAIASAVLVPLVLVRGAAPILVANAGGLLLLGIANSALPFTLFGYATLTLTAGFAAILNATAPLWAALVAWVALGRAPTRSRALGLAIGFAGVVMLIAGRDGFSSSASALAIAAGLAASLSYGIAVNFAAQRMSTVGALVIATGSQIAATLCLVPLAWWTWPETSVGAAAWAAVVLLGVGSTALAYLLYFRLVTRVGSGAAISVTFLVPVFASVWGGLVLGEAVTLAMAAGGAVVLVGTALANGVLERRRAVPPVPVTPPSVRETR